MSDEEVLDEIPVESDTPPDHKVLGFELPADTLPEWWHRFMDVAPQWATRMSVLEKPELWYVRVELHQDHVEDLVAALGEAWGIYQDDVAAGRVGSQGEE